MTIAHFPMKTFYDLLFTFEAKDNSKMSDAQIKIMPTREF